MDAYAFTNIKRTIYSQSVDYTRRLRIKQNLSNLLIFSYHIGISIRYLLKRTHPTSSQNKNVMSFLGFFIERDKCWIYKMVTKKVETSMLSAAAAPAVLIFDRHLHSCFKIAVKL